jgi:hypothetical protein
VGKIRKTKLFYIVPFFTWYQLIAFFYFKFKAHLQGEGIFFNIKDK